MAQRVANRLWSYVAPGGVLCIPNFNAGIPDAGYLECFMDWWLIYRDRDAMTDIAAALPVDSIESTKCELLDEENIWYLQAKRVLAPKGMSERRFDGAARPTHTSPWRSGAVRHPGGD